MLFMPKHFNIFTDGAIRPGIGASGLAAVVRDETGAIRFWWQQRAGQMTCNEAEYAALILALENLRPHRPAAAAFYSDSRVVVDQMRGLAGAHAPGLRQMLFQARQLAVHIPQVSFHHIPREWNRLADALANDVFVELPRFS